MKTSSLRSVHHHLLHIQPLLSEAFTYALCPPTFENMAMTEGLSRRHRPFLPFDPAMFASRLRSQ
jgi:hypothetical protein